MLVCQFQEKHSVLSQSQWRSVVAYLLGARVSLTHARDAWKPVAVVGQYYWVGGGVWRSAQTVYDLPRSRVMTADTNSCMVCILAFFQLILGALICRVRHIHHGGGDTQQSGYT